MNRAPFVVTALTVLGPVTFAGHLALDPDPFSAGPAVALAAGLLVFALLGAVGLLLSRGRWSLRLCIGLATGQLGLFVVVDAGVLATAATALAVVSIALLTGPWLDGWIRKRPAAGGPGPRAVMLLVGTIALLPGTALGSPHGFDWQHVVFVAVAPAVALAYSRASLGALWLLRVALMPFSALAVFASPPPGGIYLTVHVLVLAVLAWSRETLLAVRPLLERSHEPWSARPPTAHESNP